MSGAVFDVPDVIDPISRPTMTGWDKSTALCRAVTKALPMSRSLLEEGMAW